MRGLPTAEEAARALTKLSRAALFTMPRIEHPTPPPGRDPAFTPIEAIGLFVAGMALGAICCAIGCAAFLS